MQERNVVTIGGGTGSFTLLSGLKKYPVKISAIVSMADDGGSTGVLRDELGVLPPGDVRQCLVALSESSETVRDLMNYRFEVGGLKGHNFGNLFLSALEKIEGNFTRGVEEAAKILNVKGEVIPVTEEDMRLQVKIKNGKIIQGESQLDHNKEIQKIGIEKIFLEPRVRAYKHAVEKILNADFIIIGPGDLYGSILPNLLVRGIPEAIASSKAKIIYNCNLTNKKGQTENFTLADYVRTINAYIGKRKIDFVIFNNSAPKSDLAKKYEKREGRDAVVKLEVENKRKYKIIQADILQNGENKRIKGDANAEMRSFIRHDSEKLAKVLMMIFELGGYESIIKKMI